MFSTRYYNCIYLPLFLYRCIKANWPNLLRIRTNIQVNRPMQRCYCYFRYYIVLKIHDVNRVIDEALMLAISFEVLHQKTACTCVGCYCRLSILNDQSKQRTSLTSNPGKPQSKRFIHHLFGATLMQSSASFVCRRHIQRCPFMIT